MKPYIVTHWLASLNLKIYRVLLYDREIITSRPITSRHLKNYLKTSFFVPDTKVCTAFLNGTLVSRTKFSGGGCETYF